MEAVGWLLIVGVVIVIAVAPAFPRVRRLFGLSSDSPEARAVRRYLPFGGWSRDDPTEALWADWQMRERETAGGAPTFAYPEQPPAVAVDEHGAATDLELLEDLRDSFAERGDIWGEANAWNLIGFVHERHGAFEQALEMHFHALEKFEVAGGDPSGVGDSLNNLGIVLGRMGQVKQAVDRHRQALEIRSKSDSFRFSNSHNNLGVLLADISPHDAEEHFSEAIRLWEQADDDAKGLGKLINNWAVLAMGTPRLQRKDKWLLARFERALALRSISKDHRGRAKTQNNLGLIHALRGEWKKAESRFGDAAALAGGVEDRIGLLHVLGNWLLLLRAGTCPTDPEKIEARIEKVKREVPDFDVEMLSRDCEAFGLCGDAGGSIPGQVALFSSGSRTPQKGPELESRLQTGGSAV